MCRRYSCLKNRKQFSALTLRSDFANKVTKTVILCVVKFTIRHQNIVYNISIFFASLHFFIGWSSSHQMSSFLSFTACSPSQGLFKSQSLSRGVSDVHPAHHDRNSRLSTWQSETLASNSPVFSSRCY